MLEILTRKFLDIIPALSSSTATTCARLVLIVLTLLLAWLLYIITSNIAKKAVVNFVKKTTVKWDEILAEKGFFRRLCYFVPAAIIHTMLPVIFAGAETSIVALRAIVHVYVYVVGVSVVYSVLNWIVAIYHNADRQGKMPIGGFVQALKLVVFFIAAIVILSTILGKNPVGLLSGLGALTAVLMLVFKDSILGFVAGIQMNANDMVRIGDWVEMPKYGADGDVIDITLTTVKVQNWDRTITTIPAYSMIADSFKNWRGMSQSGGRRIMRNIYIDMTSIKFCDGAMLDKFRKVRYISEYIDKKQQEICKYNDESDVDNSCAINGRRMTNVGTLRAYISAYLQNHPQINQDMTFLIRQLEPTSQGLPLQIYVFCKDKVWANYEGIQSDIFDHILSIVPEFDLRIYQNPSGYDLRELTTKIGNEAIQK